MCWLKEEEGCLIESIDFGDAVVWTAVNREARQTRLQKNPGPGRVAKHPNESCFPQRGRYNASVGNTGGFVHCDTSLSAVHAGRGLASLPIRVDSVTSLVLLGRSCILYRPLASVSISQTARPSFPNIDSTPSHNWYLKLGLLSVNPIPPSLSLLSSSSGVHPPASNSSFFFSLLT